MKRLAHVLALVLSFQLLSPSAAKKHDKAPEQVHLAPGQAEGTMTLSWMTHHHKCSAEAQARYGKSFEEMDQNTFGTVDTLVDPGSGRTSYLHTAVLTQLEPGTRYFYQVGSENKHQCWSQVFNFRTFSSGPQPLSVAMVADLGVQNPQANACLMKETTQETIDMVIHAGDIAYDLDDEKGKKGDRWMQSLEPVMSKIPYFVAPGNHEAADTFLQYTKRFGNMPSNSGDLRAVEFGVAPNVWYYSYNVGITHFVFISTEIAFFFPEMQERQLEWLEEDLQRANEERSIRPWIIICGHRPLYCSASTDCDDEAIVTRGEFAEMFHKYGVDLYVGGHSHTYERMYDIAPHENQDEPWTSGVTTQTTTNMPATTFIVDGVAGPDHLRSFKKMKLPRTAHREELHFGYGKMTVYNETHLLWRQLLCDDREPPEFQGMVLDEAFLIQNNHGPFPPPQRPSPSVLRSSTISSDDTSLRERFWRHSLGMLGGFVGLIALVGLVAMGVVQFTTQRAEGRLTEGLGFERLAEMRKFGAKQLSGLRAERLMPQRMGYYNTEVREPDAEEAGSRADKLRGHSTGFREWVEGLQGRGAEALSKSQPLEDSGVAPLSTIRAVC